MQKRQKCEELLVREGIPRPINTTRGWVRKIRGEFPDVWIGRVCLLDEEPQGGGPRGQSEQHKRYDSIQYWERCETRKYERCFAAF